MKKRFLAVFLSVILGVQSIGCFNSYAEKAELPEDCEEIEFDKKYWGEPGEVRWFKFEAPAPQCYFTDMKLEQIYDYIYGWNVAGHRYYDAEGNDLGLISYTNDPDVAEWTEFEPGETYYIKIMADKKGTFYTLSPIRTKEPAATLENEGYKGIKTLTLTGENVDKFIMGNTNTLWDVYTVTEDFIIGKEDVVVSSDYFVVPYEVCFGDSTLTVEGRKTTYSAVDRQAATHWDSLSSFTRKPYTGHESVMEDGYVQAANHYAYTIANEKESAKAQRSYNVYVPSGKRLKLGDDGCIYPQAVNERFTDISADAWYTDAITEVVENKFMNGMGQDKFSPSTPLTRAQFVMILANIEGVDLSVYKDKQSFSDVTPGAWYSACIEWAKETGITSGVGEGRFAPNDPVTRQQLAMFFCTYADLRGIELYNGADLGIYTDQAQIADWARPSVEKAVASGLMTGMTLTTLDPRGNATRAQIAVMINNFNRKLLEPMTQSVFNGNYFLEGGTCGYSMYDELIELSGKENPHVLYIGMAGDVPTDGYDGIKVEMCGWRGCTSDILLLEDLPTDTARQKIEAADIIYVTGGSSRMLLERLRRYGTDAIIREAAANGTVMSGSSAGAICFGAYGASSIRDNRFENLYGVGCADVIVCPHGLEEKRVEEMKQLLLQDATLVGVSVDYAALEISGGMYRIYTEEGASRPGHGVKYWNEDGVIMSEDINSMEWRPLSELYN